MMFSGSVLSEENQINFAPYAGVGLELHDGLPESESSYLRFRTDPSLLEIATDKFYFGRQNMMYISGSEGIIEISSSNFLLSSSGDVFINGTVNATSGSIGGWEIFDGKLVGGGMTLSGSGEISTSYFSVSTEGAVTASDLYLSGNIQIESGSDTNLASKV